MDENEKFDRTIKKLVTGKKLNKDELKPLVDIEILRLKQKSDWTNEDLEAYITFKAQQAIEKQMRNEELNGQEITAILMYLKNYAKFLTDEERKYLDEFIDKFPTTKE